MRLPGLGGWSDDPLWAGIYDFLVENPTVGRPAWGVGLGSSLQRLYDACDEIGELPEGARVLDVPCGGGVALRGVRAGQGLHYVAADISETMLERTMTAARERGVADQVTPVAADVAHLQFDADCFDLVVSFTGLHCFPDPHAACLEMGRVTRHGGRILGSAMLKGTGVRQLGLRAVGTAAGLLGPGATAVEVHDWLESAGFDDVRVELSGAIGYFRGVRR